jgi:hypothetical protein
MQAKALLLYSGGYIRISQTAAYGNNFYILWENHTTSGYVTGGSGYGVLVKGSLDNGKNFGNAVTLDKDAGAQPLAQMVIISQRNNESKDDDLVYILWNSDKSCTFLGGSKVMFAKSTDNGDNFSNAVSLTGCVEGASAQLAASGNKVYVVWNELSHLSHNLTTRDVFLRMSNDAGSTFNKPVKISDSSGYSIEPSIATATSTKLDNDSNTDKEAPDNAYVIWMQSGFGSDRGYYLHFQKISGNETILGTPLNIIRNITADAAAPRLAAVAGKNGQDIVYVVWGSSNYYSYLSAGLSNNTGSSANSNDSNTNIQASRPQVLFMKSSDGGMTFGNISMLSNTDEGSYNGQLKMFAAGNNVFVMWQVPQNDSSVVMTATKLAASTDFGESFNSIQNIPNNSAYIDLWGQQVAIESFEDNGNKAAFAKEDIAGSSNTHEDNNSTVYISERFGYSPGGGATTPDTTNGILFEYSRDGGRTWSSSKTLARSTTELDASPLVSSYANNVYVVWAEFTSNSNDIILKRSPDYGSTFADAQSLADVSKIPENGSIQVSATSEQLQKCQELGIEKNDCSDTTINQALAIQRGGQIPLSSEDLRKAEAQQNQTNNLMYVIGIGAAIAGIIAFVTLRRRK